MHKVITLVKSGKGRQSKKVQAQNTADLPLL